MGIERLSLGKDYAAEFMDKTRDAAAYNRGRVDALTGTTIPIGQPAEKKADEVPMGLGVERTQDKEQTDEVQAEVKVEEQPAVEQQAEVKVEEQKPTEKAPAEEAKQPAVEQQPEAKQQPAERTLDDKATRQQREKEVQAQVEAAGTKFEGGRYTVYTDKKEYKEAKKAAKEQYEADFNAAVDRYMAEGYDKKSAKKRAKEDVSEPQLKYRSSKDIAKDYVKNERQAQKHQSTQVFMDEDAYKQAQEANKTRRNELIAQYQAEGMSEGEAKKKADRNLPINRYVNNKDTRAFVLDHKEAYYDENGFSSDRFKESGRIFANWHTGDKEAENYNLSLKERRDVANTYNANPENKVKINDDVIADVAKLSGLSYEQDHTKVYQGLYIGGTAAVGAAVGAVLSPSASAVSNSISSAGNATSGAIAGAHAAAHASADLTLLGLGTGAAVGAGTAGWIQDKGGDEAVIPNLEPKRQKLEPIPPTMPTIPTTPINPIITTPCPEERWNSESCDYVIKKAGEGWGNVMAAKVKINGKPAVYQRGTVTEAYVHALKLKHGITDMNAVTSPNVFNERRYNKLMGENPEKAEEYKNKCTMRLYEDFSDLLANEELVKKYPELLLLKDAQIELECDDNVKAGKFKPARNYVPYNGLFTTPSQWKQNCRDNEPVLVR